MKLLVTALRTVLDDRRAASATEYALMAGILAVGLISSFAALLSRMHNALNVLNF